MATILSLPLVKVCNKKLGVAYKVLVLKIYDSAKSNFLPIEGFFVSCVRGISTHEI